MKMSKNITKLTSMIMAIIIALLLFNVTAQAAEVEQDETATTVVVEENERKQTLGRAIRKVPLFNQMNYHEPYGDYGTIASHGCGIVSVAMVATYLTDIIYAPEELADRFGNYNTEGGSVWALFKDSANELGLELVESGSLWCEWYDWDVVMEALKNGQPVISLQGPGLFTSTGHFIVLTGLTEDEKILVNDPNGNNWAKDAVMVDGFKNGFTLDQIRMAGGACWIYGPKVIEEPEMEVEEVEAVEGMEENQTLFSGFVYAIVSAFMNKQATIKGN